MSILIDPTRTVEYVLEKQRGVEEKDQFRFLLRVITARRWARMVAEETEVAAAEGREVTVADTNLMLLRYGCLGWKGPEGQPASALDAESRLTYESIDLIPAPARVEIADKVWRLNTVFERDVGFSQQP